ncbi:MarR family winged helix-turn-helix transcriptional regulator [Peribacillus alkalitolerans]|uniref:MarR family winged helix-turn-helix transcriptional regulator n=1 Tax=Peribacillus alkalitolerans TaxID=1550385 RepID=UPI001F072443|nr:MarR family transcriptional regulator [Peribacillus alkalitolerans]
MNENQIYQLEKLFRKVFRQMRFDLNELYGTQLNANEFSVLRFLLLNGNSPASSISKYLNVSASHITSVTDSLVKKGFIIRLRSDQDRRLVLISLTEEGKMKAGELEKKKSEFLRSKFDKFTEEELEQFIQLFRRLE